MVAGRGKEKELSVVGERATAAGRTAASSG